MRLIKTELDGVLEITSEIHSDERGSFFRAFDLKNLQGIVNSKEVFQINVSTNLKKGTIRGLHLQQSPYSEWKVVRCLRGSVFDVAVDLRPQSKTFLKWTAIELTSDKCNAILIPEGFAHGFQTLEDDTLLLYIHSKTYEPGAEMGINYADPSISITWPLTPRNVSDRDKSSPYVGRSFE
jgi:dTDP-4-dehydrorhamnose 3,5-epimerase